MQDTQKAYENIIWGKTKIICFQIFPYVFHTLLVAHFISHLFLSAKTTGILTRFCWWMLLSKLTWYNFPQRAPVKNNSYPVCSWAGAAGKHCAVPIWGSFSAACEWWGYQGFTSLFPFLITSIFCLLMSFAFPFQSRLNFPKAEHQPHSSGFYNERFYLLLGSKRKGEHFCN